MCVYVWGRWPIMVSRMPVSMNIKYTCLTRDSKTDLRIVEIIPRLHNCSLGLHKWEEKSTCSLIAKRNRKVHVSWLQKGEPKSTCILFTKGNKEKYMYSDYKRGNRKIHVSYPIRLLLEDSPPLHLFFHMSLSTSASFFSRLSCWFSEISASIWPSA